MQIWSEGYAVSGNSSGAFLLFEDDSKTFQESVDNYNKQDVRDKITKEGIRYYCWGCRLFDNREDADKSFK